MGATVGMTETFGVSDGEALGYAIGDSVGNTEGSVLGESLSLPGNDGGVFSAVGMGLGDAVVGLV